MDVTFRHRAVTPREVAGPGPGREVSYVDAPPPRRGTAAAAPGDVERVIGSGRRDRYCG
ncbi:hypothetical protein [Amycolatopsis sp. NBC_00438]|uniref:hypothetical protein n=1 Tax=Amycolatopsis sp. NBC_00438 TaxID=2903558 RepID=UPI002E21CCDE